MVTPARQRALHAGASRPATLNDTSPDRSRPWSSTVTPGSGQFGAQAPGDGVDAGADRVQADVQRLAQRIGQAAAQRQRGFRRFQPRRVRSQHGRAVGTERRTVGVDPGRRQPGQEIAPHVQQAGAARAQRLRPAPASTSQPTCSTSMGIGLRPGPRPRNRRCRVRAPPRRSRRGLIRPPLAGSQVSAIRRTRSSSMARSASGSTQPSWSDGMVSTRAPARSAISRMQRDCRPIRAGPPGCGRRAPGMGRGERREGRPAGRIAAGERDLVRLRIEQSRRQGARRFGLRARPCRLPSGRAGFAQQVRADRVQRAVRRQRGPAWLNGWRCACREWRRAALLRRGRSGSRSWRRMMRRRGAPRPGDRRGALECRTQAAVSATTASISTATPCGSAARRRRCAVAAGVAEHRHHQVRGAVGDDALAAETRTRPASPRATRSRRSPVAAATARPAPTAGRPRRRRPRTPRRRAGPDRRPGRSCARSGPRYRADCLPARRTRSWRRGGGGFERQAEFGDAGGNGAGHGLPA